MRGRAGQHEYNAGVSNQPNLYEYTKTQGVDTHAMVIPQIEKD